MQKLDKTLHQFLQENLKNENDEKYLEIIETIKTIGKKKIRLVAENGIVHEDLHSNNIYVDD
jgi:tRNA A-37 threonylcarbamoyl transferase component Bud32